jgi:hypothetical protein
MAARIDDVLAIDDVDHIGDAPPSHRCRYGPARMISGIANRHFTFFIECQFIDDEQLDPCRAQGILGFAFAY